MTSSAGYTLCMPSVFASVLLLPLWAAASPAPLGVQARAQAPTTEAGPPPRDPLGIVGGEPAEPGVFPSVVALYTRNNNFGCTGTLIAPDLVLTAGHCGLSMAGVLAGTHDLTAGGTWYAIQDVWVHPDYASTFDVAVYQLSEPVQGIEPAPLLLGCDARDLLVEGADTYIVGFGDIDTFATQATDVLHAAVATIRDPYCTDPAKSCNLEVSPGGELIAGGDGIDTCNGDSGGPLFVETEAGMVLAGVTSRQALPSTVPCGDGGIYPRTDAFAAWVEEATGLPMDWPDCPDEPTLNLPPVVRADRLQVIQNGTVGATTIEVFDDPSQRHRLELLNAAPAGQAWLHEARLFVRPDPFSDADYVLQVEVTDDGDPPASTIVEVPVEVLGITVIPPETGGCTTASAADGSASWWRSLTRRRVSLRMPPPGSRRAPEGASAP